MVAPPPSIPSLTHLLPPISLILPLISSFSPPSIPLTLDLISSTGPLPHLLPSPPPPPTHPPS